jgi:hypothetical protein
MGSPGALVRLGGLLVGHGWVILARFVIALPVMLSGLAVRFRGIVVVLCCFFVRFLVDLLPE